jgi:hypothetical protein
VIFASLLVPSLTGNPLPWSSLVFALAACTTVAILVLHEIAGLFGDRQHSFKQHPSIPKGASQ